MFLLHERIVPNNTPLPEEAVLATYGVATLALLVSFRDTIRGSENALLLIALGLFAASLAVDLVDVSEFTIGSRTFVGQNSVIEDGPKFVGIACWAAYFLRVSWLHLDDSISRP